MAELKPEKGELQIEVSEHILWAKGVVKRFAEKLGFYSSSLHEIELCVAELATNLIVHKVKNGRLSFNAISENGLRGIEITAQDEGPGIKNLPDALRGGVSSSGSLGQGLASVQRFADEFEIHSNQEGTHVKIRKYLPPEKESEDTSRRDLTVSVSVRTHPESTVCGDGHIIRHDGPKTLLAVIDGLGHGKSAREAAAAAEAYIHANYRKTLEQMPEELHSILRHTRGAVASIARIDEDKEKIDYIGVGNISARLWLPQSSEMVRLVSMSGTLGVSLRTPRLFSYPWKKKSVLIMHSDGIREHWEVTKKELSESPTEIAQELIKNYWRKNDDATVLVAK
ncbi:SpoIIE family protein phosphatase [bacterium]|nr:SpoIIE family protein phosphatase [bacterium]